MESLSFESSSRSGSQGERAGLWGFVLFVFFFGLVLGFVLQRGEGAGAQGDDKRVFEDPEPRPGRRY
jgi:hypothetical protein